LLGEGAGGGIGGEGVGCGEVDGSSVLALAATVPVRSCRRLSLAAGVVEAVDSDGRLQDI
jgi:hypothetical protein